MAMQMRKMKTLMAMYRIYLQTVASTSVDVEIDDTQYDDEFNLSEAIENAAYAECTPSLCAQCSGWGQGYSVDLGEWEPETAQPGYGIGGLYIDRIED